ncbi:mini-chromosome maintenance complex-binding protein [Hermetia illucens]|nr:mini-chromosome maintenance complex-binding protein [Hermetia illucens]
MEIPLLNLESFLCNENGYLELLQNPTNWQKIPFLNHAPLHELKDLSLVRFRGMIQDMCDPEIYLEKYEVRDKNSGSSRIQQGKYRDCLAVGPHEEADLTSNQNVHGDRRTIFVITVPGLNDWAVSHERSVSEVAIQKPNNEAVNGHGQKRSLDDETENMEVEPEERKTVKRLCNEQSPMRNSGATSDNLLSSEYLLNSPLPDRPSKACMVKLYSDFDKFPLNSIVDVVGFLSVDPALDGSNHQIEDFEEMSEVQAANPPPSLIPRLHAILVKPLDHVNPLLDESLQPVVDLDQTAEVIRKDLHIILTQCLFGDPVAAEFLLLHLISNVFLRTDMQTLGQFSLNICGLPTGHPPGYTTALYDIIQSLLPASHYFPMTLENMNTHQFLPKKDYKTNKLVSGLLQLAPHTHLILDETRLEPGKLENNGVRGVQSLADLIKSQQIKANFEFFEMQYDMNIPVLTLSEGRSMLPCDFQIPLKDQMAGDTFIEETLKAAKHYLEPKLNAIRKYLTTAKLVQFNIDPETTQMIEQDFVDMRKADQRFGPDQLSSLLILARLLAAARGRNMLDKELWNLAKSLQAEQQSRLEQLPKRR